MKNCSFKTAYSFLHPTKLNLFLVLRHRLCLFVGSLSSHTDALCLRSYAQMLLPFRGHSYARCAHIFMLSRSNAIMFPIRLLKVNFHRRLVIHDTSSLLWSSPRPISDSQLHVLPHFHLCPIYLVVFKGVYFTKNGISHLEGGFTLRCLQRLSRPDLATRPCTWQCNRYTRGQSIPVLSY